MPFGKSPGDPWTPEDLQAAVDNGVPEGWVVEFKREPPAEGRSKKIARSIASFANTYGGWYIVGIRAEQRAEDGGRVLSVASEVTGFDPAATNGDPVELVRNAVRDHIDPLPLFFPHPVDLGNGRIALAVYVPGEQETPFLSSNGQIYRRIADASEPVNDRYTLDRLIDRGRELRSRFAEFAQEKRIVEGPVSNDQGWLAVYLSPYPLGTIDRAAMLSWPRISELIELSRSPLLAATGLRRAELNLTWGQTTNRSVFLRRRLPRRPNATALDFVEVELLVDGRARMLLPLPYKTELAADPDHPFGARSDLARQALRVVHEDIGSGRLHRFHGTYFDLQEVWYALAAFVGYYRAWLGDDLDRVDLRWAMRVARVEGVAAFFDADAWGNHVLSFGLPTFAFDALTVPTEIGGGETLGAANLDELWRILSYRLAEACGFPIEMSQQAEAVIKVKGWWR